ncbi:MAG: lysophospholipid acyltransferase family protein [Chthoniobacteraceae bacterium]
MSPWKRFRYRLEQIGCAGLAFAIPLLPRGILLEVARCAGTLAFHFDRRGRKVALENLDCVFGQSISQVELEEMAKKSFQNFVQTMLDLFWAKRLDPRNYQRWIKTEGFDLLRQKLATEKRGAIFMCVHEGNWEWASLACGFLGFGNVVVAENFKNPRLTEIFKRRREHSGQTLIPQENSILRLLKVAKRGGATGMLIDLNLKPSQAATILEAFGPDGLKMCVPMLHAVIAHRTGALLVPVETQPQPDGACRIIAHPPVEWEAGASVPEIAQRCWDAFEPIIKARPELYLWPYKHFRFRPRDAERRYPEYANESSKFDKLAETCRRPRAGC